MSVTKGLGTLYHRNDTAANFTSANPIMNLHEFGFESDTGLFKIGDGVTAWTSLSYNGSAAPTSVHAAVVATGTTQTSPFGFATAAQGDDLVTLVNQMRAILIAMGKAV